MAKKKINKSKDYSVWMISREYDGLAGAGGVKDVCRQLAETLAEDGLYKVRVIIPRYGFIQPRVLGFSPVKLPSVQCASSALNRFHNVFDVDMNYAGESRRETVSLWRGEKSGVTIYMVEAERFAEKFDVYTYTTEEESLRSWQRQGAGHFDYFAMNILLQKAALGLMILLNERPHIIHCQDGHAAVLPALIRELEGYRHFFRHTGTVLTIHNAGTGYHQEVEDLHFGQAITGLPDHVIRAGLLNKAFDPIVSASGYAVLNTVSEQYARELQETPDDVRTGWLGHALRKRGVTLAGITNGINPKDFDSTGTANSGLPASFDVLKGRLKGKKTCKEQLLRSMNSRRKRARVDQFGRLIMKPDQPLFTFIGRLTHQKGVDLLVESFTDLLEEDSEFQLLVLGSGDPELEASLTAMAEEESFSGRMCFLCGYDQQLALKIYAAGDFFLIPSLFEPCGLTDYIAQLFGNLPIVHSVGGLVKVDDGETGFAYTKHSTSALSERVMSAMKLYREEPKQIREMQRKAYRRILDQHTWKKVMVRYQELYDRAVEMACSCEPVKEPDKLALDETKNA